MTQDLFDSGDEPPEVDDSGGERKTESEGEERARKELEDEHAQWEREHSAHLSPIETPLSQRAQPDSGDEAFIVSSGDETIFDSQDSDYRASTTEESEFQTMSENSDSDYQDRLAIVVRNSVEEVADDDEPKPSPEASPKCNHANANPHDVSNCSNVPVKGTPTPRSRRETPPRVTDATQQSRSSRHSDKRTGGGRSTALVHGRRNATAGSSRSEIGKSQNISLQAGGTKDRSSTTSALSAWDIAEAGQARTRKGRHRTAWWNGNATTSAS